MGLLTFKGGIHPNDGKSLAKDKAIVEVLPEGDLVFPLSQHIGAPAAPIVKVGDQVLKGQKIAEAGGFVSAPVYSSVSGKVKAITPYFTPTGGKVSSIIIENDGAYTEAERLNTRSLDLITKEKEITIYDDKRRNSESDRRGRNRRNGRCRIPYKGEAFTEGAG